MNLKKAVLAGVAVMVLACTVIAATYQGKVDRAPLLADQAVPGYGMSGFATPDGGLNVIVWNTTTGESALYTKAPGDAIFRKSGNGLPAKPLKE